MQQAGLQLNHTVWSCSERCIPLLIQQNVNGSIPFFNRSWEEFKVGFNDSRGNYWLGNELLHQLTMTNRYKLRFDLVWSGSFSSVHYGLFVVLSEQTNYTLLVSGYSGCCSYGDALGYLNRMMFTTYDRDNDPWTHSNPRYKNNCAVYHGCGFWYKDCGDCGVNASSDDFAWGRWTLQSSRMWLVCF